MDSFTNWAHYKLLRKPNLWNACHFNRGLTNDFPAFVDLIYRYISFMSFWFRCTLFCGLVCVLKPSIISSTYHYLYVKMFIVVYKYNHITSWLLYFNWLATFIGWFLSLHSSYCFEYIITARAFVFHKLSVCIFKCHCQPLPWCHVSTPSNCSRCYRDT